MVGTDRSLETVSLDLKEALLDLEDLQQALSSSEPVKADDSTQLAEMGARFFKGLSAVHLVCNTGHHAAQHPFYAAVHRHDERYTLSLQLYAIIMIKVHSTRVMSVSCMAQKLSSPLQISNAQDVSECLIPEQAVVELW